MIAALVLVAIAAGVWLATKDRGPEPERAERQEYAPVNGPLQLPGTVLLASAEIRELYEFAARRPEVLHYLPCFCGCWRAGHKSNYDCFIDEVRSDGAVDIDEMGFT